MHAVLRLEPVVRCVAVAVVRVGGVDVPRPVILYAPRSLVRRTIAPDAVKSWSPPGTIYHDEQGAYSWITIHPNGDDAAGHPVKVRPSKAERGVWHVVGGAGGSLNYMKLTGVRSPDEQRQMADERRRDRKAKARAEAERERARRAAMTPEERAADDARRKEAANQRQAATTQLRERQREQIARVARAQGWADDEWQFAKTRRRLEASGTPPERIAELEELHHRRAYQRARDAVRQTKRLLAVDRARVDQVLGGEPQETPGERVEPQDVAATPRTPRGHLALPKDASDEAVRAALVDADHAALAGEVAAAEQALAAAPDDPVAEARLEEARTRLRVAALLRQARDLGPDEVAARRRALATEIAAGQKAQTERADRLRAAQRAYAAALEGDPAAPIPEEVATLAPAVADAERKLEALRQQAVDLDVMAGAASAPVVEAEARTVAATRRRDREAAIRREQGDEGVARYRALRAQVRAAQARHREDAAYWRATGELPPAGPGDVRPISDPQQALEVLAAQKAIDRAERALRAERRSADDLDERIFGKPSFLATGTPTPEMIAAAERDMAHAVEERLTRAFLDQVESPELVLGRSGVLDGSTPSVPQALAQHLGDGAYQALNGAALAAVRTPILRREVVDVLGAGPAAALLAHTLRERVGAGGLRALATKLGEHHVAQHVRQAGEAMAEVQRQLDAADQAQDLTNPADVALAVEANHRRAAALEAARRTAGQALGQYEATAALVHAFGASPPTELHANLGPITAETAVRQMRALGLGREDYALTSDGRNYLTTVKPSGFAKLTPPVDAAHEALVDDLMAIRRGERDEAGWRPKGTAAAITYAPQQQRAMKAILRAKRIALALGAGSGKTGVTIGALSHLVATPGSGVRRGLFLVPASIQGQFHGEFRKFAPGLRVAATPGGDRATRLAEHRKADAHAVVQTHQAFRDDMLHLVAQHWGVDEAAAREKFLGLSRTDARGVMRAVWKRHGIDYQMLTADESHGLLDRENKPDALVSRLVQAVSDLTPYYVASSADPIKNDLSELRSLLDKLHPDGRYSDADAWKRRYAVPTSATAAALQREVAGSVYAAHVPTGNTPRRRREEVALHPAQRAAYGRVLAAYDRARAAHLRGEVDVEAARVLAPERMAAAKGREEAVARELQSNLGMARDVALRRIVDLAPRAENAKIAKALELVGERRATGHPVVIFANRHQSVHDLAAALQEAGHRVETLTGADTTAVREKKRQRFQPETGEPQADVFVLSDAGAVGLNLQRGQTVIQFDRPYTEMIHAQRFHRIDRLGQQHPDIDLIDLVSDTPFEARAERRLEQKAVLRATLTDPAADLDDTGLGEVFALARRSAAPKDAAA